MARQKREVSKIGVYHILLRGVDALFLSASDYECFLSLMKEKMIQNGTAVIAYLLLENRVHMVLKVGDAPIGTVLKPICTSYARYCNRTRVSAGKLFYDRFRSEPINDKNELAASVAFVNAVALQQEDCNYSSYINPLCSAEECGLTEAQLKSSEITKMFIEDYDCLTKEELLEYIYSFCGVRPEDFSSADIEKRKEICERLTEKYWISKSKVYELLGVRQVPKRIAVRKADKETDSGTETAEKKQKKDLSVWLL